ncbi:hypothetical protein SADUNF_Sadunf11G0084700 [Salix dunnii]|uniref:Uncharacterized protein n=1 Tax=Salix dunnii TaxID=1413687 RepID=A0A835JKC7_9ROSI|nr:hypothetical protein SADUNF_Sadunf11G0084700 [Salix dunnii]
MAAGNASPDFKVLVFLYLILAAIIALEGVEALFQHRIVRAYCHRGETPESLLIISEGTLIIYEYLILVVFDTIISCIFFKSCKATSYRINQQDQRSVRPFYHAQGQPYGAHHLTPLCFSSIISIPSPISWHADDYVEDHKKDHKKPPGFPC